MSETVSDPIREATAKVLDAARFHVVFDGWSEAMLTSAVAEAGVERELARAAFPRGVIDLAYAFHVAGDEALASDLAARDLGDLRYSERVGFAVFRRLEIAAADREAVRRAASFFGLPIHAATGSKAVWHTADTIWTALGDTSDDLNWYTKRAILSGVYSSSLLFWLGDETDGFAATRAFVDRRIENVMQFEKMKADVKKSPVYDLFRRGPGRLLDHIKAPGQGAPNLPGRWSGKGNNGIRQTG